VDLLGVRDVEGLVLRLETILNHRAPDKAQIEPDED
jgi:hypothetical protein